MQAQSHTVAPLDGFLVVDAGMNVAGPYAASVLADLGAMTIKLEPPAGDTARLYPPITRVGSTLFASVNHNKRYLCADLKTSEGRGVLSRVIQRADALIQNLRPEKTRALGLDAATCHSINPRLVHCSIEAFYPEEHDRAGFDVMAQAESGLMDITGRPGDPPNRIPPSILDHGSAIWAALSVAAALHRHDDCEAITVSLMDVAMAFLDDKISTFLATGQTLAKMGSETAPTTPHQAYKTADGFIVIAAGTDRLFSDLCHALGLQLDLDPRFSTHERRLSNRSELTSVLKDLFLHDSTSSWISRLSRAKVPVATVRDFAEAVDRHREMSATGLITLGKDPAVEVVAPAFKFAKHAVEIRPTSSVGGDSRYLLAEVLGFTDHEVDRLIQSGSVVG